MIQDGFVLGDKEAGFDKRFDITECLFGFRSFLRNYRVGGKPFDVFLTDLCKKENINPRLVLALLRYGGLLVRKHPPAEWVMRKSIPMIGKKEGDLGCLLERSVGDLRALLDAANTSDPLQVIDGAILPKTRLSYALFLYVPIMGTKVYPDTGMYQFMRFWYQLNRFVKYYKK